MAATSTLKLISPWRQILSVIGFPKRLNKPFLPSHWHYCFNANFVLVWPYDFIWRPSRVFVHNIFKIPNSTYSPEICLGFSCSKMSRGHWAWPLSRTIPFEYYSQWPGFNYSLNLFLRLLSTFGVRQALYPICLDFYQTNLRISLVRLLIIPFQSPLGVDNISLFFM